MENIWSWFENVTKNVIFNVASPKKDAFFAVTLQNSCPDLHYFDTVHVIIFGSGRLRIDSFRAIAYNYELFCSCHEAGEPECCYNPNVAPVRVELFSSRFGSVILLLGVCSEPIARRVACQDIRWTVSSWFFGLTWIHSLTKKCDSLMGIHLVLHFRSILILFLNCFSYISNHWVNKRKGWVSKWILVFECTAHN